MKNLLLSLGLMGTLCLSLTSCGTSSKTSNALSSTGIVNTVNAASAGSSLGGSISSLYSQYKQNGSIQLANANNLLLMQQLISNASVYKQNYKNSVFLGSFTTGLISGSNNLVNKSNQSSVLSSIMDVANSAVSTTGVSNNKVNTISKVATSVSSVSNAASSVNTLMSLFGK